MIETGVSAREVLQATDLSIPCEAIGFCNPFNRFSQPLKHGFRVSTGNSRLRQLFLTRSLQGLALALHRPPLPAPATLALSPRVRAGYICVPGFSGCIPKAIPPGLFRSVRVSAPWGHGPLPSWAFHPSGISPGAEPSAASGRSPAPFRRLAGFALAFRSASTAAFCAVVAAPPGVFNRDLTWSCNLAHPGLNQLTLTSLQPKFV